MTPGRSRRTLRPMPLLALGCAAWIAALMQSSAAEQTVQPSPPPQHQVEFATSENCLACHNGMRTPAGEDASIGVAWRASMMANSSRDPYWQASVRRETIDHPSKKAVIEDECAICHMPMSRAAAHAAGREAEVFRLLDGGESGEHQLALDGVSCTLCHQIGPERLGTRESFVGGFVLARPEGGERRMFARHQIERGLETVMRSATGVRPAAAAHLGTSEMCATCHTLYTEAFDAAGRVVGTLPEQVPYLEWKHSAFANERGCQSCHMPDAPGTPIASVLGKPRDRMARHTFLGGNFFVLRMLGAYRQELGVVAPAAELDAAAHATLRQLERSTAALAIANTEVRDGTLLADVVVRNLTGHKLPTGYPSRRAWLRVAVSDAQGRTIFESGAVDPSGAVRGNDNDADPARYEPHYDTITSPDQVQIYESVMTDPQGRVTTGLLRATGFVKDNRLLPRGFDVATAAPDIAVQGGARQDANFSGEGDRIRYAIPVGSASGPYRIAVELRYQPIGFRWADNLRTYDAPEPRRFVRYFDALASGSSAVLADDTTVVR